VEINDAICVFNSAIAAVFSSIWACLDMSDDEEVGEGGGGEGSRPSIMFSDLE
jgi:hypothetical protein